MGEGHSLDQEEWNGGRSSLLWEFVKVMLLWKGLTGANRKQIMEEKELSFGGQKSEFLAKAVLHVHTQSVMSWLTVACELLRRSVSNTVLMNLLTR